MMMKMIITALDMNTDSPETRPSTLQRLQIIIYHYNLILNELYTAAAIKRSNPDNSFITELLHAIVLQNSLEDKLWMFIMTRFSSLK